MPITRASIAFVNVVMRHFSSSQEMIEDRLVEKLMASFAMGHQLSRAYPVGPVPIRTPTPSWAFRPHDEPTSIFASAVRSPGRGANVCPPWTPLSSPPRAQRPTMLYILHGDATDLRSFEPGRPKLLAHVSQRSGLWGPDFRVPCPHGGRSRKFQYRHYTPRMGDVQFVAVEGRTVVANMVAQHGVRRFDGDNPQRVQVNKQMRLDRSIGVPAFATIPGERPPLRYSGPGPLHGASGLHAWNHTADIHCPQFGSGLAGGDWNTILLLILELWVDKLPNTDTYVYEKGH